MKVNETRGHPFLPRAPQRQRAGINMKIQTRLKSNGKPSKPIKINETRGHPFLPRAPRRRRAAFNMKNKNDLKIYETL